ncbi:hypothetical protein DZC78_05405 [Olleya aquimaris]|uniref:Uncharacterized protein n=1 Tax=Olleya sediminilitoris TaxID=2795739 RepID=A0ABS1WJL0_9FLAO|nr:MULTISPECIES: hypothetical protein [Olleya]AXO79847.1 hypothetical protein DZC78_05405 [Olleya aquimaris]MBL7559315.1 hypothetical protein [Olleya sediminilitoris]
MSITTVEIIVFSTIGLLILLNTILNINYYKNDTINVVIKNWSYNKYFFIPFLWGVFGGHFFLGSKKPVLDIFITHWEIPPIVLAVIVIIMIIYGRKLPKDYIIKTKYQIILLVSGLLFGHFIWSQRHEEFIQFTLNN